MEKLLVLSAATKVHTESLECGLQKHIVTYGKGHRDMDSQLKSRTFTLGLLPTEELEPRKCKSS